MPLEDECLTEYNEANQVAQRGPDAFITRLNPSAGVYQGGATTHDVPVVSSARILLNLLAERRYSGLFLDSFLKKPGAQQSLYVLFPKERANLLAAANEALDV